MRGGSLQISTAARVEHILMLPSLCPAKAVHLAPDSFAWYTSDRAATWRPQFPEREMPFGAEARLPAAFCKQ